ncbi:hypothetical protein [Sulfitobacter aestuariivivens]|uniref:hypothetical protein n=1 Tax=Sulfitobacter aestuariivivens TaxID=2766981 RepID=UPI00360E65D8
MLTHLKARLAEALDRQSATAEILDVISSSPRDARPVFDAIVHAGQKLFPRSTISIGLREGDNLILGSISGPEPAGVEAWRRRFPAPLHPETIHGHVILEGKALDLPDVAAVQDRFRIGAGNFLASGFRAVTMTPISQGGRPWARCRCCGIPPAVWTRNSSRSSTPLRRRPTSRWTTCIC